MQPSFSPSHRESHGSITFNQLNGDGLMQDEDRDMFDRLNRRRSTTTTVTTTGVDSSSDHEQMKPLKHHPLADIRPSSRRFLGAEEYYDDTSGGGGGVEYAVMVPDSFAVLH